MAPNTDARATASTTPLHDGAAPVQTPESSMGLSIGQSWSMREAAEVCGVSLDTIKRRRRDGAFPGASMVDGAWQIPSAELANVAAAEGWTLVLPDAEHGAEPEATGVQSTRADSGVLGAVRVAELEAQLVHVHELHGAEIDAKDAERVAQVDQMKTEHAAEVGSMGERLDRANSDIEKVTAERDRARSDLEHLRAELDRVKAEKADIEKTAAVAEALAAERAEMLAKVETAATDSGERADAAVAALGWLGRRRYRRNVTAGDL